MQTGTHMRASAAATAWIDRPAAVLLAAILMCGLIRLWLATAFGLTEDEAYYRLWALAPAKSYLDHPPMSGWMIAFGRWLAGDTPLGIRLPAILVSLIGPLVLWRTANILLGPVVARRATWIALAMPLLAVGGVIITPDTPSVLFWGLAGWALAELYSSRNANWWLVVGLTAGLGLLSKYSNLFVGASILLWMAWSPGNRVWLRRWQLWAGGVLACLLALPVVLWNLEHDWASVIKQIGRAGRGQHLTLAYLGELLGGNLGVMSPIIAVLGGIGLLRLVRLALKDKDGPAALIVCGIAPFLAYLLVHALHSRVQLNWVAPLYGAFALCAAVALDGPKATGTAGAMGARPAFGRLGVWAVGIGLAISVALYWHTLRPFVVLPGQRDPTSQTRGWRELAAEVERARLATGACWIATSSYATTAQLAYQLKDQGTPVVQITERIRYVHLPPPDPTLLTCPALYVELHRRGGEELVKRRFGSVARLDSLTRRYAGVSLGTYVVYLASGLDRLDEADATADLQH
jgi:4-amino-4-deoxy-L-arabinose transferase-like glycosyltransferase